MIYSENNLGFCGIIFSPDGSWTLYLTESMSLLRAFFTAHDTEGALVSLSLPDGSRVDGVDVYTFLNAGSQKE